MSLILVTYDLKVPGKDYKSLYEALKTASGWWHHLESTWILSTNDTVQEWTDRLTSLLDKNDRLLVVDITKQVRNGWLTSQAWDWLRTHDK